MTKCIWPDLALSTCICSDPFGSPFWTQGFISTLVSQPADAILTRLAAAPHLGAKAECYKTTDESLIIRKEQWWFSYHDQLTWTDEKSSSDIIRYRQISSVSSSWWMLMGNKTQRISNNRRWVKTLPLPLWRSQELPMPRCLFGTKAEGRAEKLFGRCYKLFCQL